MQQHPSIEALTTLIKQHNISIELLDKCDFSRDWCEVKLSIGSANFTFLIDDEYDDLRINSAELRLSVVLKSLEEIKDAHDLESWLKATGISLSASNARDYFNRAKNQLSKIEELIGEINSQISDLDFSLNAGASQSLRAN